MSMDFDWITRAWVHGLDAGFADHIGRQVAISVDDAMPQVTTLVQSLHCAEEHTTWITFCPEIVVPRWPPPSRFTVLDEHWQPIMPKAVGDG
jgi:hypothetical protein